MNPYEKSLGYTMKQICKYCGSPNLDLGTIYASSNNYIPNLPVYFASYKKKFFSLSVPVKARVCLDCGNVNIVVNNYKLKKTLKSKYRNKRANYAVYL